MLEELHDVPAGQNALWPSRHHEQGAKQRSFGDFPSSSNNGKEHLVATKHERCGWPKSFLAAGVHDAAGRRVQGYQNLEPFRGEREHLDFGGRWQVVQQISSHWHHCIMGCCMMSLRGVQVGNSEWQSSTDVPMLDEQMPCLFMTPSPTLGKNSVSKHHISQPLFSHKNHPDFSVG